MKDKLHLQSFENDDKTSDAHVYSPKANGGSRLRDRSSRSLLKQLIRSTASFCPVISKKNDENGIALLFTLGILSLLLILAVAFATTSMTSRKMASNFSDRASARMLAHNALQKSIAILRYYAAYNYSFSDVVSHYVENANQNYYDFLWRMETQVEGLYYFDWPGYNDTGTYNPNEGDMPQWHYVDNGRTGDDQRIIGRYAYKVIGSGGKLDPSVTVRHQSDLGGAVNEYFLINTEVRNGIYQHEINIRNLEKGTSFYIDDTIVSNMSSNKAIIPTIPPIPPIPAGGTLPDGERWVDFETMFSSNYLNITDSDKKAFFKNCFILDNSPDPEAFWVDDNKNGIQDVGELYHRFNLARTDWDLITVDTILGSPTKFDTTSPHDGTGILWLKNSLTCGTFPDDATRAKQIAANLKDYCDSDNAATTDNENEPTYTGNDLTPYINEVGIRLETTASVTDVGGDNKKFRYVIKYVYSVELINMYGSKLPTTETATLAIEGTLTYTFSKPYGEGEEAFQTDSRPINTTINFTPDFSSGYSASEWEDDNDPPKYITFTEEGSIERSAQIKDVSANIKKVKLTLTKGDSTYFADFSRPGTYKLDGVLVEQGGPGSSSKIAYFSFEANDPRQNLNTEDWEESKKDAKVGGTVGTLGTQNNGITCTSDGDAESGSTPTTISTAFIRNAPMRSPWELGAIHRGAKWETLNIKYYNKSDTGGEGVYPDFGIGDYSKGDANILDQVKMTSDTQVYGKINIQEANQYVLAALLADIGIGCAFYSGEPGASPPKKLDYTNDIVGPDIRNPDPSKIVKKIMTARDNATIKTRAQIALLVAELYGGTSSPYRTPSGIDMDNDIKREELIGKFINLTKGATMTDTVPIVVIAQSIKDTGSPSGMAMQKDLNCNGVINDNVNDNSFHPFYGTDDTVSESNSSVKLGRYECGFDEITGECKILAFVNIDPVTKRPTILKLLYPDLE